MFKEILGDAYPIIEKVAPAVAQAIGGPFAGSAMLVISMLAKHFGVEPHDIQNIGNTIFNDPDAETKLSEVQSTFLGLIKANFINIVPSKAELNLKLEWEKR